MAIHDPPDAARATPPSTQSDQALIFTGKRAQKLGKRTGGRKRQSVSRNRMIWPPRTNRQSDNNASLAEQHVPPPRESLASSSDKHEGSHHASEIETKPSDGNRSRAVRHRRLSKVTRDSSPDPTSHALSQQHRSSRIAKQQRHTQRHGSSLSSSPRPSGHAEYTGVLAFDSMIDGLKAAFHAESKRTSKSHESKVKSQLGEISTLEGKINSLENRINALQAEKEELRTKAREQIEKSNRYVKGIQNDYHKLKEAAKAHRRTCSSALEKEVAELQKERVLMERDFRVTLDAVEKSQRSTKSTMSELFHSMQLSEAKKRHLIEILKLKDRLLENESTKRVQLEEQVLFSMHSLQQLLQDNNGVFLERLSNFQTALDNSIADDKRDACIRDCLDALKTFQTSTLCVKDVQKAEHMLRFIHER